MSNQPTANLLAAAGTVLLGAALLCIPPAMACAQRAPLPNAPHVRLVAQIPQSTVPPMLVGPPPPMPAAPPPITSGGPRLTIHQAEQIAIRNNPHISVARLLALAQGQVTREARSAYMPTAYGDLEAVGAHSESRMSAVGDLQSSRLLEKAAGGLTVSQLIADFGHTHNLVLSAQSNAKAQFEDEAATNLDITLTVDQAFYRTLTAQAVLRVAQETVAERQAIVDTVNALAKAKLRSDLDLSFADVQLSQAKLMLLDAENDSQVAMAALNTVLGSEQDTQYTLVDQTQANPPPPPQNAEPLVQQAFNTRPDLAALNDTYSADMQYSKAERDQWMPTISALAVVGGAPVRSDLFHSSSWYGGAGANVNIPIFNGFLFNAQTRAAKLRAGAALEQVRNLRDDIARNVRTAVLNTQDAFQRIGVEEQLLNESNFSFSLAQARYKLGLSGIIELSQSELQLTRAQIGVATARYGYQTALAVLRYQLGQ